MLKYYTGTLFTPIGTLKLTADEKRLKSVSLCVESKETGCENEIISEAKKQLNEYFEGTRKLFDLPLCFEGTDFQKDILITLAKVPYGTTLSYGNLAKMSGHEKACRAVGNAVHNNPYLIVVPCHRVIGANNKLGGFALGSDIKKELLEMEGAYERTTD